MSEQAAREPRTLAEILATFESRFHPFDPHEVAEAVRAFGRQWQAAGKAVTIDIRAEWLAFTLMENYRGDEGFAGGTYYGPVGVFHDAQGKRVEMPPLDEITPDVVAYWQERARTARQPLLQIRYADLAWEFGRRAKLDKMQPEVTHPDADDVTGREVLYRREELDRDCL